MIHVNETNPPAVSAAPVLVLGVLKPTSPLCEIFGGGRVVPLKEGTPKLMMIEETGGRQAPAECVVIPIQRLTKQHRTALIEWVAANYKIPIAEAQLKIGGSQDFPVHWSHFSGIVEGESKQKGPHG